MRKPKTRDEHQRALNSAVFLLDAAEFGLIDSNSIDIGRCRELIKNAVNEHRLVPVYRDTDRHREILKSNNMI